RIAPGRLGRCNGPLSAFAFVAARGSLCVFQAKRTSPLTRLSRIMRAWPESAEADGTLRNSAARRTKSKGNSLRRVISHPLAGNHHQPAGVAVPLHPSRCLRG